MVPNLFANSTTPLLIEVARFTEARHGVLAGNIANINTPGYETRDLSVEAFRERLRADATARHAGPSPGEAALLRSGPGLVTPADAKGENVSGAIDPAELSGGEKRYEGLLRHDGTNVSLEHQVTEISKNQSQHNLAVALMATQFRQLRAAISENAG